MKSNKKINEKEGKAKTKSIVGILQYSALY